MKIILSLLMLVVSAETFALDRATIELLLSVKHKTLKEYEAKGAKTLMGEVTGHISFNNMHVMLTESEAILKEEVDSIEGDTIRFNGQYILKSDIKAMIVK